MIISNKNKGFTLIELMISLVMSLIIIAAAGYIYVSGGKTYRLSEELQRLQENGRYAIDRISQDLRMIGYTGCNSRAQNVKTTLMVVSQKGNAFWEKPVIAEDNKSGTVSSLTLQNGSDYLTVSGASPATAQLIGNYDPSSHTMKLSSNPDAIGAADIAIISDCEEAHIFQTIDVVSAGARFDMQVDPSAAVNSPEIKRVYKENASISSYFSNTYFNAKNPEGHPALYVSDIKGNTTELVDRVASLQYLFGESTDGNDSVDRYVVASAVTNWDRVYSIRVNLLLESLEDHLLDEPVSISFNGNTINSGTGADKKLRIAMSSTVAIRNKIQ